MRRLIDNLVCILVTLSMFALPVVLVGLAPWLADTVLATFHIHPDRSLASVLDSVLLMMGSAGGMLLLAAPLFGGVFFGLSRLSRFSSALVAREDALPRGASGEGAVSAGKVTARPQPTPSNQPGRRIVGSRVRTVRPSTH